MSQSPGRAAETFAFASVALPGRAPCKGVGIQWVRIPIRQLVVPAGSSRNEGGFLRVSTSTKTGRCRRLSERTGHNVRERRASSENGHCRSRPSALKGKAAAKGQPNGIDPWFCRSKGDGTSQGEANATRETRGAVGRERPTG